MNITKLQVLKYSLFLICDIIVSWLSLTVLNVAVLSLIMNIDWLGYIAIFAVFLIIRGIIITVIFKNLKESIFIYPTIFTGAVFLIAVYWSVMHSDGGFYPAIVVSVIVWWINVITVGLPCLIYNEIKSKTEKHKTVVINRYPYIENRYEWRDFEKARTRFDDADADRKIDYAFFKDITIKNIASRGDSFSAACISESKEVLESLANKGVFYLMHFSALGSLSAEKGEKVDFVGVELHHIHQSGKLELLKCRINEQSFALLKEDLQKAMEYYLAAE